MLFILLVFLAIIFINYLKFKPNSVVLFLYGITIGFIEMNINNNNDLSGSIDFWLSLDPDKLLFYFVPPLIFYASFGIDFHIFRRTFGLILALSIVGIFINCSLISLIIYSLDPVFHNWNSLIVGVILSAIDPIAVAAILPEFTLSEKTINLIEGESLINDEITITLFHLLMYRLIYSDNYSQLAIKWCSLTFGGFLLGFLLSVCIVPILHRCHGQLISEIATTISFSYFAYYIGEFTEIEFSGILSIVILGLFMSVYGKTQIYPDNLIRLNDIWEILAYFSNALIFTLTGLIISYKVHFSAVSLKEWGILTTICLLIIILRLITCGLFFNSLKKNILHYDFHDYLNISFSGFRGEISLALSLIVLRQNKLDISIRNGVLFYTAGVTFFTIVFNCIALSIINFVYRKERLLINQNQFDNIRMLLKNEARTFLGLIGCQNEKFHLTKVNLELVNKYLDSNFQCAELVNEYPQEWYYRKVFLNTLKKTIWMSFKNHQLHSGIVYRLIEIVDNGLDYIDLPWCNFMNEYCQKEHIQTRFTCFLHNLPILKYPYQYILKHNLETSYNLVSGYILAIKNAQQIIYETFSDEELIRKIDIDVKSALDLPHNYVTKLEETYSLLLEEIETRHVIFLIIDKQKFLIEKLQQNGEISVRLYEKLKMQLHKQELSIQSNKS